MEIYKDVVGYEGLYKVSNLGNVKSLNFKRSGKEKLLKVSFTNEGYLKVGLHKDMKQKTRTVHQLVAEAFLNHSPNGHKLVINHIDFVKTNNKSNNLEIVTHRKNSNKKHLKSTSKYVGVSLCKSNNKWRSEIDIDGETKFLGYYYNESNAHLAYQHALKNLQ